MILYNYLIVGLLLWIYTAGQLFIKDPKCCVALVHHQFLEGILILFYVFFCLWSVSSISLRCVGDGHLTQARKLGSVKLWNCQTPEFLFLPIKQIIEEIWIGSIFGLLVGWSVVWLFATMGE